MKDEEKLTEISASINVIDWLAIKGAMVPLHKSLSRICREAIYDLLEDEVWGSGAVHHRLLTERGCWVPKNDRDTADLGETMFGRADPLSDEQADQLVVEVDRICKLVESTEELEVLDEMSTHNEVSMLDVKTLMLMRKVRARTGSEGVTNGESGRKGLTTTINISVTPEMKTMIKNLYRLRIYTSQSELVRRALKNYLDNRVWVRVEITLNKAYKR